MTALDLEKLFPRVVFATPFRIFAIYISLFCAAVAATFFYVNISMQDYLSREAQASVQADYDSLAARYRDGGLESLIAAISEHSAASSGTLYLLTDQSGRRLAGNLDTVGPAFGTHKAPLNLPIAGAMAAASANAKRWGLSRNSLAISISLWRAMSRIRKSSSAC